MKITSKISLALIGTMLMSSVCYAIIFYIMNRFILDFNNQIISIIASGISSITFPVFFSIFMTNVKKREKHTQKGEKISLLMALEYLVITLGGTAIIIFFYDIVIGIMEMLLNVEVSLSGVVESELNSVPNIFIIITVVIIGPISEEYMFRKIMLMRLLPYGEKTAVILTSLLFGLYHMNFEQFFYTAFIGGIFAIIVLKTNRIVYAIIMHMFYNLFGSVLSGFIPESTITASTVKILFVVLGTLSVMIHGKILFSPLIQRRIPLKNYNVRKELTSAGFVLYILFFIVASIGSLTSI